MRPRNIEFSSSKMKPNTQVYAFFDDIDVNKYCTPKLIEISMTSGTFQVGETVEAEDDTFAARVANSNHKYGPYNNPDVVYVNSPYDRISVIPATYSSTSTILNIDTFSLQDENTPNFEGHVKVGMKIRGSSSGAQATVTNVRLVTDYQGVLIGCFEVPDSSISGNPSWKLVNLYSDLLIVLLILNFLESSLLRQNKFSILKVILIIHKRQLFL